MCIVSTCLLLVGWLGLCFSSYKQKETFETIYTQIIGTRTTNETNIQESIQQMSSELEISMNELNNNHCTTNIKSKCIDLQKLEKINEKIYAPVLERNTTYNTTTKTCTVENNDPIITNIECPQTIIDCMGEYDQALSVNGSYDIIDGQIACVFDNCSYLL